MTWLDQIIAYGLVAIIVIGTLLLILRWMYPRPTPPDEMAEAYGDHPHIAPEDMPR